MLEKLLKIIITPGILMKTSGSNNAPKGLTKEKEEEEFEFVVMIWSPGKARDFSAVEFCEK